MLHPSFPYEGAIPDGYHPLMWAFLHVKLNGVTVTMNADDMDALARHVFDDLGAQLPVTATVTEPLAIAVDRGQVGKPFALHLPRAEGVKARVTQGQLPPGLSLAGSNIVGVPDQSGLWQVTVRTGPSVKYQAPLDGPIGSFNPGTWVDIDKPLEVPTPAVDVDDLDDDVADELERKLAERRARKEQAGDVQL